MVEVDDWVQKQIFPSGLSGVTYLTTITGFLWEFIHLSLKTCSLYHEKLFIQVVNDISNQVFNNFFSASDIKEAVRGHLCFYGMNARLRDSSYIVAK